MTINYKKWLRRLGRLLAVGLLLAGLLIWYGIENLLPYWPIKPLRQHPTAAMWRIPRGAQAADYGLTATPLTIHTADSLSLKALYIPAASTDKSTTTLIMVHGISSCKEFFLPAAEAFHRLHLNVVLIDMRAHGESEGTYCTFGVHEKSDISILVDTLLARNPGQKIGILGNSLGGAIALQCLANDPRLQFGIIESTFNTLEAVVEQYGVNYFGIRSPWLAHHTLDKSAVLAHFDPYTIRPCDAAKSVRQPIFMAHGDADERIPFDLGRKNWENLAATDKQWYTVHGAGHHNLWAVGGANYAKALDAFIQRME